MVDGKHTIERLQFHSDGRWYTSATFLFGKSLLQHLYTFVEIPNELNRVYDPCVPHGRRIRFLHLSTISLINAWKETPGSWCLDVLGVIRTLHLDTFRAKEF